MKLQASTFSVTLPHGVLRVLPLAGLVGILAVAHTLRARLGPLDPLLTQWPRLCPLYAIAGIRCPTCGLGRALIDAAAGDVAQAFHHHPLGPLLLGGSLIASLLLATQPALLQRAIWKSACLLQAHPRVTATMVAGYIVWGAARELC